MTTPTIKNATLEDMDFLLFLAGEEGWNPGVHDALPFYETDPRGFFIAEFGKKTIGCVSAVAYDGTYGFLGFYIIIPQYRGRGWGLQLWNHAVAYLGSRCIGLDGVLAQQENYKKSGFRFYYKNIRFQGNVVQRGSSTLVNLQEVPLATLWGYDTEIYGLSRQSFLNSWVHLPDAHALGKIDKGRLLGYGVIRKCLQGWKIGPLFADDLEIADEIYQGLCAKVDEGPVFLDIPEINEQAKKLADRAKLKQVFETARMYTRPPPPQQLNKVFGVTTFELG